MTGPRTIVYTDAGANVVRTVSDDEMHVVAGHVGEAVEHDGGGYHDGSGQDALFNGPYGIAADGRGGFIVADSANRRIRRLSPFDRRSAVDPRLSSNVGALDPDAIHVLLVGSSFLYWDVRWRDSIPGLLESKLNALHGRRVQVTAARTIGFSLQAQQTYVENVAGHVPFDYVVFLINGYTTYISFSDKPGLPATEADAQAAKLLHDTAAELNDPRAAAVAIFPYPHEFMPTESLELRTFAKGTGDEWIFPSLGERDHLSAVVRAAGLPVIDLWPPLIDAEASPARVPLYGTTDDHFSRGGCAVVAGALAKYLLSVPSFARAIGTPHTHSTAG